MGKYHPANYKNATEFPKPAPTSVQMPPTNLSMPSTAVGKKNKSQPGHERYDLDVARQIKEYKRQMTRAQMAAAASGGAGDPEPISPQLLPLGSPGPITPFELEEAGQSDYVVAGGRGRAESLIGNGLERERDREIVSRMIRAEEERRGLGGKDESKSPALRL